MPEGGELRHCADVLSADLTNLIILRCEMNFNKMKSNYLPNGPNNINLVEKSTIKKIYSKGKKLIFELLLPNSSVVYMVSSLGMTGKWLYKSKQHTSFSFKIVKVVNNIYVHKYNLHYDDVRKFGSLDIYLSEADMNNKLDEKVGPDFLAGEVVLENYIKEIQKSKKQISVFMLDQEKFSGVGNYLRAEILYLAKINPFRISNTLTVEEITQIYNFSIDRIDVAYKARGLSFSDYEDPYGRDGSYDPLIYDKKISPEGYNIKKEKTSDGRTIHWVSEIQI